MTRGRNIHRLWLLTLASDFAAVVASYYLVLAVRFHVVWGERVFGGINRLLGVRESGMLDEAMEAFYTASAFRIIVQLTVIVVFLYALNDLYTGRRYIRPRPMAWGVLLSNAMALGLFYGYFYLGRNVFHPRSMFALIMAVNTVLCVGFRVWMNGFLGWMRERLGVDVCPSVLVGEGQERDWIEAYVDEFRPHGMRIVGAQPGPVEGEEFGRFLERVGAVCRETRAAMLVCAVRGLDVGQVMRVLEYADGLGVPVKMLTDKLDVLVEDARQGADRVRGHLLVHFNEWRRSDTRWRLFLTRVAAGLMLVALLPLLALIAALIRLTSPGGALFVQERIGVDRQPFQMLKFRTMRVRADELQAQVEDLNESGDALFKMRRDPRVTGVGRFLRRFSLDELPQLYNIYRGEMVFVGPRPLPRRDFERYYEEWHYGRHAGKPGLTCLWQVSGRSNLDFHNMCILDVYYLRNRSWVLDAKILLRTVWAVLFAKGAY